MVVVVNLFGAPGTGKSTLAADLFARLKRLGVKCELITEFPKDCVYEGNMCALMCQEYVFGNQSYRMFRCSDKVDVIITDSPLPLSILYKSSRYLDESFDELIWKTFNHYVNINYLLLPSEDNYKTEGRIHSKIESEAIHKQLQILLDSGKVDYQIVIPEKDEYKMMQNILNKITPKDEVTFEVIDTIRKGVLND